jgi:hypothetical protein
VSIQVSPDVVWIPDSEEVRLYDASAGEFRTLNQTAARIWRLAAEGRGRTEIAEALCAQYADGDPRDTALIAADVADFIDELVAQHLLVDAVEESTGAERPADEGAADV